MKEAAANLFRQLDNFTCWKAVEVWLKENGFTFLASGCEARVYAQDNSDFVVKVFYAAHWHNHESGNPSHKFPELEVQGPGIARTIPYVTSYEVLIVVQERVSPFDIDFWAGEPIPEELKIMMDLVSETYGFEDTITKNFGEREDGEIVAIDWTVPEIAKETQIENGYCDPWA